jgi:hypothetical protein
VLSQALSVYRRHFGALVLTCALALLPANLLAAGAVVFGLASLGAGGGVAEARTHAREIQEKPRDLQDKPPQPTEERARLFGHEAFSGTRTTTDVVPLVRRLVPIAYAIAVMAALLLAGLFLAQAAIVPLVLELGSGKPAGPSHCWAVAGSRIGALLFTGLMAAFLVALGAVFFVVPGLILAAGFSLAAPIVVVEGLFGREALERSWRLLRGHRSEALLWWLLILAFSVLASGVSAVVHPGPWRPVASSLVRIILYPLPLVGLVLLYRKCVSTSAGSPPPDSSARGSPGSPLR